MDHGITLPGALRRAPFALLAWVLSARPPADLLGPDSRALVLRALLELARAARAASVPKSAGHDQARDQQTLEALAQRANAAVLALGADYRALTEEALPPPTTDIDHRTVARVLFAFMEEARRRTATDLGDLLGAVLDPPLLDLLAVRASALDIPAPAPASAAAPRSRRRA